MRITVELVEVTRSFGLTGASQTSELDKIRYQSYLILSEPSKKPYLFLHKIRYRELEVSVEIITGKGV